MKHTPDFLAGGGEMAALSREHDWRKTPLGAPDSWEQSLRTAVSICLTTPFVSAVHWGPDLRIIYNDAYAPALAERHPRALGQPFRDVWPEIWDVLGPQVEQVLKTGRGFSTENQLLRMERNGQVQDTYWIYSFAPIHGDGSEIGGVFVTAIDNTANVLAERRRDAETERLRRMFEQAPGFITVLEGPAHRFTLANAAYRELVGDRELIGKTVAEALPEAVGQGYLGLLDQVFATGEAFTTTRAKFVVQPTAGGPASERYIDFVYQPIANEEGRVTGIFVEGQDVTEAHRADAVLLESEARFRNVADHSPVMMWMTEPDGYCSYLNKFWYEFTGQTEAEALGLGWTKATHPDDQKLAEDTFLAAVAAQASFRVEYRLRRADGVYRWAIDAAAPRFGEDGRFLGHVGSVIDIDERREAEEKLALNEERLRLALEVGEIGQWHVDNVTGDMFWPPRVKAMFGISPDVPVTLDDFINGVHPEDREQTRVAYEAASDPERRPIYDVEYRTVGREDGLVRWVAAKGRGLFNAEGYCYRVIGTAVDVTSRKADELRLRELNETLEAQVAERTADRDRMWRLSTDLMLVARFDAVITAVNPAWSTLLGWAERELIGRRFIDLVHPEDVTSTLEEAGKLGDGQTTLRFENRYQHKDGSFRWLSWTAVPGDNLIHAVARDVSAEREQAEILQQTEEALRQAQKMEAVGQLTGGIAHDFNNLLTGVIGSLDMMQRRIAKGEMGKVEHYATTAMTSANRAAALTHRLLAFSRRQPLDPKPVNSNRLVSGMEELLRRTLGEAVRLEIVTAGGLWQTLCDPHQLESAILNLAINARDAMPDGGNLTIETCNAHLDTAYAAKLRGVPPGQYVCICVTDTGTGMSPDVIAKAFDPFFTTKPIGQGTGLGLSMIYGFARQSEGYAKIYSEVDQGTTFKLYLPRYYGEGEDADVAAPGFNEDHRAEHGEVVLVVEDETAVREIVVDVLEELGYRAIQAADGPSGLKILQTDTRVDLLVSDVGLPGLNGRQLADQARERRRDLKVLFMTGYAENATIANGFLDPGMEMITKPFAIESLATRIRGMIESK
ncbi:hybrid sensor histidine kinase/response regulator [Sphingomonas solaris]|uniref:hybrid sensor histidine kinase/response regulator n=1 Tax=Alterirhizorhabdus solaris TaxID=2529389 RepID=UPI0019395294|nr:PAS domain S-box protein [Sphingomonas solaris]